MFIYDRASGNCHDRQFALSVPFCRNDCLCHRIGEKPGFRCRFQKDWTAAWRDDGEHNYTTFYFLGVVLQIGRSRLRCLLVLSILQSCPVLL